MTRFDTRFTPDSIEAWIDHRSVNEDFSGNIVNFAEYSKEDWYRKGPCTVVTLCGVYNTTPDVVYYEWGFNLVFATEAKYGKEGVSQLAMFDWMLSTKGASIYNLTERDNGYQYGEPVGNVYRDLNATRIPQRHTGDTIKEDLKKSEGPFMMVFDGPRVRVAHICAQRYGTIYDTHPSMSEVHNVDALYYVQV